jgi:hypothetical protein
MATAAGVITSVGSLYNTYNAYKNAKNTQAMSYGDALTRAQNTLDSLYDKRVTSTVKDLDNASASRGFYGQAAADQLKSNTIGDIRQNQASHVANLASQLQGQSVQNAANAQNAFTNSLGSLDLSGLNGAWNYLQALGGNASNPNGGSVSGGGGGNIVANSDGSFGYETSKFGLGSSKVVMDNNGKISLATPNYGLTSGLNPNLTIDYYGNRLGG